MGTDQLSDDDISKMLRPMDDLHATVDRATMLPALQLFTHSLLNATERLLAEIGRQRTEIVLLHRVCESDAIFEDLWQQEQIRAETAEAELEQLREEEK